VQALLHGEHYTRVSEYDSFPGDYVTRKP